MVDSTTRSDGANCRLEKVGYGNKIGDNISSDQIGTANLSLITHRSNSNHLDRIQVTIASKENILSQTAVKVLMRRRDKLSLQLHHLQDDIAECDRKIHTILNETGGDDDFALKIESIIEGCNDVCVRSVTEERTFQLFDDQSSPQYGKRKKLPEAILSIQNPCQELDALCHANDWILPTYHVCPAKGGFKANVTIKGEDFDYSSEGDLHSKPREARESAAALILQKFRSLAAQGQHL
ncbi:hypothetical protein TIFTF001_028514 [Ficus carica]|uniref:DRBM domain-containing protein n=1 Tax=Ficus carica TaxID=3494 RepID=A0AA88DPY5_FICCA|nr:hypothetical protein TIFTF001_028514 [Ficus carica]